MTFSYFFLRYDIVIFLAEFFKNQIEIVEELHRELPPGVPLAIPTQVKKSIITSKLFLTKISPVDYFHRQANQHQLGPR